jgi:Stress responsive A/B Barrel Domain
VEFQSKEDRGYYVKEDKAHRRFVELATGGGFVEEARVVDYEAGVY